MASLQQGFRHVKPAEFLRTGIQKPRLRACRTDSWQSLAGVAWADPASRTWIRLEVGPRGVQEVELNVQEVEPPAIHTTESPLAPVCSRTQEGGPEVLPTVTLVCAWAANADGLWPNTHCRNEGQAAGGHALSGYKPASNRRVWSPAW